jgi:general secretion pathway protein G
VWYRFDGVRAIATTARRRAFTLIELIVVIAIIATLASLVAPSVFRNTGDAKTVAARAQVEMLAVALEAFRLDIGSYPSTQEGLQVLVDATAAHSASRAGKWRGPYLRRGLPTDPWGRPYAYENPSSLSGEWYTVTSLGRDGEPGGDGEDADVSSGLQKSNIR